MEVYGMAHGFNIRAIIKALLAKILQDKILLICYTNSKCLYNYLIKLRTTYKNCQIINVLSLC